MLRYAKLCIMVFLEQKALTHFGGNIEVASSQLLGLFMVIVCLIHQPLVICQLCGGFRRNKSSL